MNPLNFFFDKIYVINLKTSVNRRNSIVESFQKYNIENYTIFPAFDKRDLNVGELMSEKKFAYVGNQFYCNEDCTCGGGVS